MKIAVFGGNGFSGKNLCNYLAPKYEVFKITRDNYQVSKKEKFDYFINANGNSKRYWANENPFDDFVASTESVLQSILDFKFDQYIYMSSVDIYNNPSNTQKNSENTLINPNLLCPYGFNKYLSELIVKKYCEKYLIFRCSALLGPFLKKGVIKDIISNTPLYITEESKLQFITIDAISDIISCLLSQNIYNQTFNIGGEGVVKVKEMFKLCSKNQNINPDAKTQCYEVNVSFLKKYYKVQTSKQYLKDFLKTVEA
jgi:nucleoside-diphosphate-sugar epimerase